MGYYTKPTDIIDKEKIRLNQLKAVASSAEAGFINAEAALSTSAIANCFSNSFVATITPTVGRAKNIQTIPHGLGACPSLVNISILTKGAGWFGTGIIVGHTVDLSSELINFPDSSNKTLVSFYTDCTNIYFITPANDEILILNSSTYTTTAVEYGPDYEFDYYVRAWL